MKLIVDTKMLAELIEQEVRDAEGFQKNIDSHLSRMQSADDDEYLMSLAKSIAYNRRMMTIPLQRASVLLELTGHYNRNGDIPTLPLIRERLEFLNALAELQEERSTCNLNDSEPGDAVNTENASSEEEPSTQ